MRRKLSHFKIYDYSLILLLVLFGLLSLVLANLRGMNISAFEFDEPSRFLFTLKQETYQAKAKINHTAFSSTNLGILPDDCIERVAINGQEIDLQDVKGRCEHNFGASIDIAPYLNIGSNDLEITLQNFGGIGKLHVGTTFGNDTIFASLILISVGSLLLALVLVLRLLRNWPRVFIAIALIAIFMRLLYLGFTPYVSRTHDLDGHIDYIRLIDSTSNLPKPAECWECHQAPLYYSIGTAVFKLTEHTSFDQIFAVQAVGLLASIGFVLYAIATARIWIKQRNYQILASLFITLWPTAILHSSRINNDTLFYFLAAAATYYLSKWWITSQISALKLTIFFIVIGFFTKTTIIVWAVALILSLTFKRQWRKSLIVLLLFALSFGLVQLRHLIYADPAIDTMLGKVSIVDPRLFVGNGIGNFICFDAPPYFTQPYTNVGDDSSGRQCFNNFLWKTSVIGEFGYPTRLQDILSLTLSYLLIPLLLLFVFKFLLMIRRRKEFRPILLLPIGGILSLALLHWKLPIPATGDFRYILPIILPIGIILLYPITNWPLINKISVILTTLFTVSAAIFILSIV